MCICFCFTQCLGQSYYQQIIEFVARRGPDYHGQQVVCINDTKKILNFHGCVLHLRGEKLAQQPAFDSYGNALLWNGEIFAGLQVQYMWQSYTTQCSI